jgi:glycosyltransferase involved in cell wall biosynthesis
MSESARKLKMAVVANTGWYLHNFRRNLMLDLQDHGHAVIAISPADGYSERFAADGLRHEPWSLEATGKNPVTELRAVLALRTALNRCDADVVLSYTPKGNIYSGLACLGTRRHLLPNVSGLGRIFSDGGPLAKLVQRLYRVAFARAPRVFFQNEDDRRQFLAAGIVRAEHTERLMGSGVDLRRFVPRPLPSTQASPQGAVTFLLIARMIREKGIEEFVQAAQRVHQTWPHARFLLLGALAESSGFGSADVERWTGDGVVTYLGTTDDVPSVIAQADVLVLPSYYREGVPRSLIEGAAMGRPVITTNMPGCRDVVEVDTTGWLCEPRDVASLTAAMEAFVRLSKAERASMGQRAHERAVRLFDERAILASYRKAIDTLAAA